MKNTFKSKITHLFKGKPNKLDKYPTFDVPYRASEIENSPRSLDVEKLEKEKTHENKKSHKKAKTNLKLIDTKVKTFREFPVLPSPITDNNESSKLTAKEFAKAVGIKILHQTDEEEDQDCDCEYCRSARNNMNTIATESLYTDDNVTPTQPIPNIATMNQYSLGTASISSSNNSSIGIGNNMNIPPLPNFNTSYSNEKLTKCASNSSVNTSNSNHSYINSRTIGTPGYYCHRSRKNSVSKLVDMSLFIPPTEQEIKNRVHSSSLSINSINSTPEVSSLQNYTPQENILGGSLDRNRNIGNKKTYYGMGVSPSYSRERSTSTCIASTSRNNRILGCDYKTSPILKESSLNYPSRIQFKPAHRCDSGTELSNANANANANINPSSPNKRPYPSSLASSSSSTTLSSAFSLTHISEQPNGVSLNSIPSSQSSQSSLPRNQNIQHSISLQSTRYSPKPSHTPLNNIRSPMSSNSSITAISSITPIKPHSNLKITRSVTITEGTRHAEIDVQPLEPDEVKVYTKGRFTITCEHSRRPSAHSFQIN